MYVVGFALLFWVASDLIVFALPDLGSTANTALGGVALVAGGIYGWRRAQRTGGATEKPTRPPTRTSWVRRGVGISLFLLVTVCWMFGLVSAEQDRVTYGDFFLLVATGLSLVSVVITGYLGRLVDALWVGWIPGAMMMAIGFSMTPTPGGDETGGGLIFVGGLVLMFGWPGIFFPLIALGVLLRRRGERRVPPASPPELASRSTTPRTSYPGTR